MKLLLLWEVVESSGVCSLCSFNVNVSYVAALILMGVVIEGALMEGECLFGLWVQISTTPLSSSMNMDFNPIWQSKVKNNAELSVWMDGCVNLLLSVFIPQHLIETKIFS